MFEKLQNKTKKAFLKVGAVIGDTIETIGDVIDEIEGPDFD